jgi:hypothetical protein
MSRMTQTTSSRKVLLSTASRFITAYNQWTVESIISIRSSGCIHHTLPATLQVPPRSKADYATFIEPMLSVFRKVEFSIIDEDDTIVDVQARKVVLHCVNRADTDAGEYRNEYIFCLTITEDGEQVDDIVEFIDTAYTADFKRRITLAQKANESTGER